MNNANNVETFFREKRMKKKKKIRKENKNFWIEERKLKIEGKMMVNYSKN